MPAQRERATKKRKGNQTRVEAVATTNEKDDCCNIYRRLLSFRGGWLERSPPLRGPRHTTTVRHMASSLRFWYLPSPPFLFLSFSLSFPFISFLSLPKVAFFACAASLVFSIGPRRLVRCREPQLLPVFLGWRDVTRSAYARGVRRTGLAEITPTRRLRHEERVTCTRAAVSLPLLRRFLRACIRKDARFFSFIRRSSMESSFFIGFILIWSKHGTNQSLQSFIIHAWYFLFLLWYFLYTILCMFSLSRFSILL